MTIAAGIAAFCSGARVQSLPTAVAERACLCVADHLHAALYGARSETGHRLIRYLGFDKTSTGVPGGEAVALLLGASSAVYEIDDVHQDTSMHPGSVVVSAALGCLADRPVSGQQLLAAIAAGYEVAIRLSIAAGERHYYYFHATATCGTLAAAAVASILYGLDETQTAHALGTAATSASGLWEDINTTATGLKHLHSGLAAERGIRAAKLAKLGLHAAPRSIEGSKGFLAALARPGDFAPGETAPNEERLQDILLNGLGERWTILRNIYKRYPFCLACFEPIEGIRHIIGRSEHPRDAIRSIRLEMYPPSAALVEQSAPQDQLQAKFSAPFAMALVLAGLDPEDVTLPKEWLADPAVCRWYPKIDVVASRSIPRRHARVTVCWNDGAEESADRPLSNLDESEVWSRFTAAAQTLAEAHAGARPRRSTHRRAAGHKRALCPRACSRRPLRVLIPRRQIRRHGDASRRGRDRPADSASRGLLAIRCPGRVCRGSR